MGASGLKIMATPQIILTWAQVKERITNLTERIDQFWEVSPFFRSPHLWGIPRGGGYVAAMLAERGYDVVTSPNEADIAVDDIIDSGKTAREVAARYQLTTIPLIDKRTDSANPKDRYAGVTPATWVVFPWEGVEGWELDGEHIITRLLEWLGEDPNRSGLLETPARAAKAWKERCWGYSVDPDKAHETLKTFVLEPPYEGKVLLENIAFNSTCEHHLLPFKGVVTITYRPRPELGVIGLSKFCRLVNTLASRLQIQERLTQQIGLAVARVANDVSVTVTAEHSCISLRGVKDHAEQATTYYQAQRQ